MGKYSSFMRQKPRVKRTVHPIWRGFGFVFLIVAPFLGYFTTILLLDENKKQGWFAIPRDLIARGADPYLYVKIIGTIIVVFLLYALFMLLTFVLYRLFVPKSLGPQDAPQVSYRGKRYKR